MLYFTDKAGNVNRTKLNVVNGIWRDVTTETGIEYESSKNNSTAQKADTSDSAVKATNEDDYLLLRKGSGIGRAQNYDINVNLGDGDDTLIVPGAVSAKSTIIMGNGDDRVDFYTTPTGTGSTRVIYLDNEDGTGSGNDVFIFHETGSRISGSTGLVKTDLNLGDGDNLVRIEDRLNGSSIVGGAGSDDIYIYDNMEVRSAGGVKQSIIQTKDGNDIVEVRGDILNESQVLLGNGDDLFISGGSIGGAAVLNTGSNSNGLKGVKVIDGGEGFDTFIFSNALGKTQTIDLTNQYTTIKGFEKFDLTGSQDNTLKLAASDVLDNVGNFQLFGKQYSNTLIIDGNAGDKVEIGGATQLQSNVHIDGTTYVQYSVSGATVLIEDSVAVSII